MYSHYIVFPYPRGMYKFVLCLSCIGVLWASSHDLVWKILPPLTSACFIFVCIQCNKSNIICELRKSLECFFAKLTNLLECRQVNSNYCYLCCVMSYMHPFVAWCPVGLLWKEAGYLFLWSHCQDIWDYQQHTEPSSYTSWVSEDYFTYMYLFQE